MRIERLLLVFALGAGTQAWAGTDLQTCAAIGDDGQRLICYDTLVGREKAASSAPAAMATTPPQPVAAAAPAPTNEAQFGAENLKRPAGETDKEAETLHSRIVGELEGWEPGTLFKLENGQVWRCTDSASRYYAASNPAVTIIKSWSGAYWMRLDDKAIQVKVRRVK